MKHFSGYFGSLYSGDTRPRYLNTFLCRDCREKASLHLIPNYAIGSVRSQQETDEPWEWDKTKRVYLQSG